jgi:hypothetical protein
VISGSAFSMPGVEGISVAMDLAVSDTDLYVALNYNQNGALLRVPIRGGQPVVMAPIAGAEQGLLVTDGSVVFAESQSDPSGGYSGNIVRIGLQGGTSTVLASGSIVPATIFGPNGILATDGQNVYFAAQDGTKSVPLAGGAVQTLTTHTGAVAVVGSNVVIADSTAEGVFSVPTGGGPATTLAANLSGDLGPIVSCGSGVCWASAVEVSPSQQGTGTLTQLGPIGSPVTLLQDPGLYVVYRLAFDGTEFFATTLADASPGFLVRIAGAGGAPVPIGPGSGLAVDDECLYLGDVPAGVYSVAKSNAGMLP